MVSRQLAPVGKKSPRSRCTVSSVDLLLICELAVSNWKVSGRTICIKLRGSYAFFLQVAVCVATKVVF
jgi:hypothetical protein